MIALKKILVPIDFSESSKKAIAYGISFGRQYQAEVSLLSVVDDRVFEDISMFGEAAFAGYAEHEVREGREKVVREKIDKIIKDTQGKSGELKIKGDVRFGIPYAEIIKYAKEEEIDVIVIGSHGNTGIKHFLLGSVTEKIIRKAPCPVLTVRRMEREFIDES